MAHEPVIIYGSIQQSRRSPTSATTRTGDSKTSEATVVQGRNVFAIWTATFLLCAWVLYRYHTYQTSLLDTEMLQDTALSNKTARCSELKRSRIHYPMVHRSSNGLLQVNLSVQCMRFGGQCQDNRSQVVGESQPVSYNTRSYNGEIPGPTLRIKRGDRLEIMLNNTLESNFYGTSSKGNSCQPNTYCYPNTTNLHVHGLHVSPRNIADNIFRKVDPGQVMKSSFDIPKDHFTGVFHYHPHFHGSTALQMLGGMDGAIIVEDDPEELPAELAAMEESILLLQRVDVSPDGTKCAVKSRLERNLENPSAIEDYFVINGQYQPILAMRPGEYRRLRIIHAGTKDLLVLSFASKMEPGHTAEHIRSEDKRPSVVLLAMDGAYLDRPRAREFVILSPGSRADVAVSFGAPGSYALQSGLRWIPESEQKIKKFLGEASRIFHGTVGLIEVRGVKKPMVQPTRLPPLPPRLGSSLLNSSIRPRNRFVLEFTQGSRILRDGEWYTDYGINGKPYDNDSGVVTELDSVHEWVIVNARKASNESQASPAADNHNEATTPLAATHPQDENHPYHQHVNHFQIVSMSHGEGLDYKVGDWRDTIAVPTPGNVTIRFVPKDYVGRHVAHCHITEHSDTGMMLMVEIRRRQ